MFRRLTQCLTMLVLGVLAIATLPTLTLASPATVSPPLLFDLAPEVVVLVAPSERMDRPLIREQARGRPISSLETLFYSRMRDRPQRVLLN